MILRVGSASKSAPADTAPIQSGTQASAAQAGQIPSLDGIRAVSIALVFLGHAGVSDLIPGGFGVTVFFFLSGFLITTLLVREQARHGRIALGAFYLRRVLRLGPPILITLVVATLLALPGLAAGDLSPAAYLSQLFFFYNYYGLTEHARSSVDGLGVLWSLSVEEHFYLIWPMLFLGIARGKLGLRAVLALLIGIFIWRVVRVVLFGHDEWTIYTSTDTRMDSLLYGCLLALMHRSVPGGAGLADRFFPEAARLRFGLIAGALAVLVATFVIRDEVFRSTLRYSVQGLALMPLFHYATRRPSDLMFRPLNWAPVRRLGVLSYTIYLCHFVIILALQRNGVGQIGDVSLITAAIVLSCGFAALVNRLAEEPLKPLRARLTGH
jgi:peptidoglycan/LPS O-acetylase OafA/YrhL